MPKPDMTTHTCPQAFSALRTLNAQRYLQHGSSSATTDGVRVDTTAGFFKTATHLNGSSIHLFTYRIRITNLREQV